MMLGRQLPARSSSSRFLRLHRNSGHNIFVRAMWPVPTAQLKPWETQTLDPDSGPLTVFVLGPRAF